MTYPPAFTIADERAYIDQAIALSQGAISNEFKIADQFPHYIPKNYPVGTALWSSFFVFLGGKWAVFWSGMTAWLTATLVLGRFLDTNGKPWYPTLILLIFPPAVVLSRHVMSEMPSMLLITIFLIFFLRKIPRTALEWIGLGALGSSVLFFREANLLLTAPLLLAASRNASWKARKWLGLGFILGIVPRLVSSYWFYGDFLYVKDPGLGFSLLSGWHNLPFYFIGLCVFIPLGGVALLKYRGVYGRILPTTVVIYLLFHLFYDYSGEGGEDSWMGKWVLLLRFLIPALPLFVWMIAIHWSRELFKLKRFEWTSLLILPVILLGFHTDYAVGQQQVSKISSVLATEAYPCKNLARYEYCSTLYNK